MTTERKVIGRSVAVALMVVMLLIGIGVGYAVTPLAAPPTPVGLKGEVLIGALLPLTGSLASYGENSKVAIELARDEVNAFLTASGAGWSVRLVEEDTETKAETALVKLQSMFAKGVKLVVGPQTSGEIRNIKTYADSNKILLISQSSTAPELRIAGDFVYRFCPDDTIQGPASARAMWERGVTVIVPLWRGDAWGDGLKKTTEEAFKEIGGTAVEGIRYAPETAEKGEVSAEVKALADKVSALIDQYGADKVGVNFIAFAEAVPFFVKAKDYPALSQVKWFGSDGTALLDELVKNADASAFSEKTVFINPIFAATKSPKFENVKAAVNAKLGRDPDSYAYAAYDAVWAFALSLQAVGSYDSEKVVKVLPEIVKNYFGASGWIVLNEGGDKASSDYELWEIQGGKWMQVGTYISATDFVSWIT